MKKTILKRPDLFLKKDITYEDKKVIIDIVKELSKNA